MELSNESYKIRECCYTCYNWSKSCSTCSFSNTKIGDHHQMKCSEYKLNLFWDLYTKQTQRVEGVKYVCNVC
jgi:hypothetical protein